jgi:hypothetical protein
MTNQPVFGYTQIDSNSISALSNNFQNANELRRELQGKPIAIETINEALAKVNFSKWGGRVLVHSFFPDKGIAYVGDNGEYASVYIKWDVPKDNSLEAKIDALTKQVAELTELVKALQSK